MPLNASILGAFVTPALFFAGAAAVSAPILIHLLSRRRFLRIRWAAMDFLIDAERRNRRRIRMEEWILLALRCLAIALIALLVARPFLRPSGIVSAMGRAQQTERVFVLDDSFSMGYRGQQNTAFDRAKTAIKRLLNVVRSDTPDDTVTILRMSDMQSPVEAGTFLNDAQTDQVLARLAALSPSNRSVEVPQVVAGVADYLRTSTGIASAAVYFITDLQRKDWATATPQGGGDAAGQAEDSAGQSGVFGPLVDWAGEERALRLVVINVGQRGAANTAVTDLDISAKLLVAGTTGTLRATVANYAEESVSQLPLAVTVGQLPHAAPELAHLDAGQESVVDVEIEFFQAGDQEVRVSLPPDKLELDDTRYTVAPVASAVRVLIVNGEPSTDFIDDETGLLTTALRPEGEIYSGNDCTVVDEVEFAETNLAEFHVVVLANVYRLAEPTVEALERFARRGGGVIFFLGDQIDTELYTSALFREGEGLLPAAPTEIVRAAAQAHLVITDPFHPVLSGLGREGDPLGIGRIAFYRYYRCELPEGDAGDGDSGDSDSGARASTSSDTASGASGAVGDAQPALARGARVIARFDDENSSPAIVEQSFGLGRVMLVTTTVDKEWNAWADHPVYLPLINEFIQHLAKRAQRGDRHWVGTTIEVALDPAVYEPDAVVRTPAHPQERDVAVAAVAGGGGAGLALKWDRTNLPGIYRFMLTRRDGGEDIRQVAVNPDPIESDLSMCEREELRSSVGDTPFEYVEGLEQLTGDAGEARTELWRSVLLLAIMVLMAEQGLAWAWGKHH